MVHFPVLFCITGRHVVYKLTPIHGKFLAYCLLGTIGFFEIYLRSYMSIFRLIRYLIFAKTSYVWHISGENPGTANSRTSNPILLPHHSRQESPEVWKWYESQTPNLMRYEPGCLGFKNDFRKRTTNCYCVIYLFQQILVVV